MLKEEVKTKWKHSVTNYTKKNNFDKMESIKKFRFDSFATEFACKDVEDVADSDSGIGKFKFDQFWFS